MFDFFLVANFTDNLSFNAIRAIGSFSYILLVNCIGFFNGIFKFLVSFIRFHIVSLVSLLCSVYCPCHLKIGSYEDVLCVAKIVIFNDLRSVTDNS